MTPHEADWLALALVPRVGSRTVQHLLQHFQRIDALLDADAAEIVRRTGLDPALAGRVARARQAPAYEAERKRVEALNVRLLPLDADGYPPRLRALPLPPPLLYCRGALPLPAGPALAVVGTRSHTRYGEKATRRLIEEMAALEPRLTIVSGLARGIDTVAHEQALACGLKTLAVMAGGLADVYPPENRGLAERIVAQGALLTEFPLARQPRAAQFPARNRIVSGLCGGVLVVEAGQRSGALITAGFAETQGRPVFAVPGNIDMPAATGTNRLIQAGRARLVDSGASVLEGLADARRPGPQQLDMLGDGALAGESAAGPGGMAPPPAGEKGRILASLARGPLHPDDLAGDVAIPIEKLIGLLLELELSGEIVQTADNQYSLA